MARIEPFKGVRPSKELAQFVASHPYDVLNSEEAREIVKDNNKSFLRIVKPEVDLEKGIDLYSKEVYQKAKDNFASFLKDNILIQDENKNLYLYKQIWGDHVQVGLVAGASAQDYQDDIIKKHELTRETKEKDRMNHIKAINANTGPVFLTFRQRDDIDVLFAKVMEQKAEYDFTTDDGVSHIFYVISDNELINKIRDSFKKIDYLYVADGHHRSASGTKIKIEREKANPSHTGDEEYNFFLSVIFPDNQMKILPYNRVVKDLNGNTKEEFFNKVKESFIMTETKTKEPETTQSFCMYIDNQWYNLEAKDGSFEKNDAVKSLDVAILQNNLLDPILGIKNPRVDNNIDFIGGIRGTKELEKLVNNKKYIVAFSLFPTSIEQLFAVADSGNIMPPKSTWFEPKLRSGLVTHLLD